MLPETLKLNPRPSKAHHVLPARLLVHPSIPVGYLGLRIIGHSVIMRVAAIVVAAQQGVWGLRTIRAVLVGNEG